MPDAHESKVLVSRWRAGDQDAAKELFDRYASRLVALARKQISQRLASRVDPEDVVQSVFRSFFGRVKAGKFHIEEQDDLGKLLVRITVHKTLRKVEFHQAAKRDPRMEAVQGDFASGDLVQVLDREPTPEAVVAFVDQLDHFLSQLRPEERQILEMRVQGYSNGEITKKLGIYDRKIRRLIERVRGLAEQEGWTVEGKTDAKAPPDPKARQKSV
ncbi:MAG TPA: sigma-70 family RNA polymerase sigma factor [Gemmataceae bacterium]|jgi:RNA polymerase sigma-70 factor (ECF subfamily)|nr:sigma-70 family RNA polymerase sigma factor [Gemmataceae bacterium]